MKKPALQIPALAALLVALLAPIASLASDERLLGALDETAPIGQLAEAQEIPISLLSVAGVKVFHSELSGLRSTYGFAPIARLSSREGSPLVLCYVADGQGVIFRSGAMGGWKRVTGFTVLRADAFAAIRLKCSRSEALAAWLHQAGKDWLSSQQLGKKLGVDTLPKNGVMATKSLKIAGKEHLLTSLVAYSQGPLLEWVDVSQFVER